MNINEVIPPPVEEEAPMSFIRSKAGSKRYGDDWVGAKVLGKGGCGIAGLWVKVDPKTQRVVDRIAVKECYPGHEKFHDSEHWFGTPYNLPVEAHYNYILNGCYNIVTLYAHSVDVPKETYRLYMEYCTEGDLWEGMAKPYQGVDEDVQVPESYLWKLYQDLAKAAVAMEHPNTTNVNDVVVHLDLKEENIFLQSPDPDFPDYPVAKVADFGGSVLTRKSDLRNSEKVSFASHTPGYDPPEAFARYQSSHRFVKTPIKQIRKKYPMLLEEVLGAANIWQIGFIISHLLRKDFSNKEFMFHERPTSEWIPDMAGFNYSQNLKNVIAACMNPWPSERPSGEELLALVNENIMSKDSSEPILRPNLEKDYEIGDERPLDTPGWFNAAPIKPNPPNKVAPNVRPQPQPPIAVESDRPALNRVRSIARPGPRPEVGPKSSREVQDDPNRLPSILRPGPRPMAQSKIRGARAGAPEVDVLDMAGLAAAMDDRMSRRNGGFAEQLDGGGEHISVDPSARLEIEDSSSRPNSELFMRDFVAAAPGNRRGLRRMPAVRGRLNARAPQLAVRPVAGHGANAGAARVSSAESMVAVNMDDIPPQARRMGPIQRGDRSVLDIAQAQRDAGPRRAVDPWAHRDPPQSRSSGAGRPQPPRRKSRTKGGNNPAKKIGNWFLEKLEKYQ